MAENEGPREPAEGELCGCGDALADEVYWMPVNNGVYATGHRTPLCQACAYLVAEEMADVWAQIDGRSSNG
jgi:hypothetical protein